MSQGYIVNKKVCKKDKRLMTTFFLIIFGKVKRDRNVEKLVRFGYEKFNKHRKNAIHVDHEPTSNSQVFKPSWKKYCANENAAWGNV